MNETQLNSSLNFLKEHFGELKPQVGIILGSGLDAVAQKISVKKRISYSDIPDFPQSTVIGHEGNSSLVILEEKRFWLCEDGSISTKAIPWTRWWLQ